MKFTDPGDELIMLPAFMLGGGLLFFSIGLLAGMPPGVSFFIGGIAGSVGAVPMWLAWALDSVSRRNR